MRVLSDIVKRRSYRANV